MDHMIATLSYFAAVAAGEPGTPPGAAKAEPLTHDARVERLANAAIAAAATWRQPGALQRTKQTPLGEMTGELYAAITLNELYVHAWDLAQAIGQPFPEDAALAADILAVAKQTIRPEGRQMGVLGPELAVPDTAPALDRLLAFMGRQARER
jgi:uncharacterized protein (TIGR03086 family)